MEDSTVLSLRDNIAKSYVLCGAMGSLIIIPVVVPFFEQNGLTLRQIFFLQALFGCALMILEIPSGHLADRWGRKSTIIAGSLLAFLAILVYALSRNFTGFLFGEILMAFGVSLHSGTIEAFTYDTLLELGETDRYRTVHGHQDFVQFTMEALTSVLAGFIATMSLRSTAWATLIPFGIGCLISFTLTEPHRHTLQEERHLSAMWGVFDNVFRDTRLRGVILLSGILSTMTLLLFWFTQPFELQAGIPIGMFGIIHAVIVFAGALAAKCTHAVSRIIGDRILLLLIAATVIASTLALGFVSGVSGLAFFLFGRIAWGFLSPIASDLVNRMTDSSVRATVLSIQSFFFRFFFFLAAPVIGDMADIHGISMGILVTGIAGTLCIGAVFFSMREVWLKIPQ